MFSALLRALAVFLFFSQNGVVGTDRNVTRISSFMTPVKGRFFLYNQQEFNYTYLLSHISWPEVHAPWNKHYNFDYMLEPYIMQALRPWRLLAFARLLSETS